MECGEFINYKISGGIIMKSYQEMERDLEKVNIKVSGNIADLKVRNELDDLKKLNKNMKESKGS